MKGQSDEDNLAVVTFKAVANKVILQVNLGSDRFEQVNGMIQMGEMQAGNIVENSQIIEFNITHNKTVEEIVTSPASLTLTVPNGIRAKIFLKIWANLANEIGNIGD